MKYSKPLYCSCCTLPPPDHAQQQALGAQQRAAPNTPGPDRAVAGAAGRGAPALVAGFRKRRGHAITDPPLPAAAAGASSAAAPPPVPAGVGQEDEMDTEDTPPQTTKRMRLVGRLLRCCSLLMGIAGSGKANQHDHIYIVAGP